MDAHSSLRREIQEGSLHLSVLKVRKLGGRSCTLSREKPVGSALDSPLPFEGGMVPADPRDEGCGRQWQPSLLLLLAKITSYFPHGPWGALTWLSLTDGPLTEAPGWCGQALAGLLQPFYVSLLWVLCAECKQKKFICCIKHLERKSPLAFFQKENLDYIN